MTRRRASAVLAALALLGGVAGGATAAQTPRDQQYQGAQTETAPTGAAGANVTSPPPGIVQAAKGGRPFTGFQAGVALAVGAAIAAAGLGLRRLGRKRPE